jgi:drug/metabolite transporter (DMT)-like permease
MMDNMITAAMLVSFLWGLSPIAYKHVLEYIDPMTLIAIQGALYGIAFLLFVIFFRKDLKHKLSTVSKRVFTIMFFAVIFTMIIPMVIFFYLLQKHDSYIITALTYSSPIFTLILAYLLLKEDIAPVGILGVLLVVVGVVLVSIGRGKK